MDELHWNSLLISSDGNIEQDEYDERSFFVVAHLGTIPIGIVRGISLMDGFPHRRFFEQDMNETAINNAIRNGFSINSLAVKASYRRQKIGSMLLNILHKDFVSQGKSICLLTAIHNQSEKFFIKNKYRVIGNLFPITNPDVFLCNMVRKL